MSITVPSAGRMAEEKAQRMLAAISASGVPAGEAGGGDPGDFPELIDPVPIWAPRDPAEASLADVEQTGWRYLIAHSDSLGAIDVALDPAHQPEVIGDVGIAERLAAASSWIEDEIGRDGDYEMRLLDLNLVGDSVLWLARTDGPDRYFSLGDEPREMSPDQISKRISRGAEAMREVAAVEDDEAGA